MTKDDIQLLHEYDRWANNRVLQAVSAMSAEQFTRDLGGSLRSSAKSSSGAVRVFLIKPPAAKRLAGEDFLEEGGDAGGGVGADFLFFLAEHEKEAVQGFANDVLVDIERGAFGKGDGLKFSGQGVTSLGV